MLGTGLVVQPLSSVDGAQGGVDAEQTHATGVYGALQRVGQLVMLITVWSQNLDNLSVRWRVFRNSDIIGWLGEDGSIVVVVYNSDVNLEQEGEGWNLNWLKLTFSWYTQKLFKQTSASSKVADILLIFLE